MKETIEEMVAEKQQMEETIDNMVKGYMEKYSVKVLTFYTGYTREFANSGEPLVISGRTDIEVSY